MLNSKFYTNVISDEILELRESNELETIVRLREIIQKKFVESFNRDVINKLNSAFSCSIISFNVNLNDVIKGVTDILTCEIYFQIIRR